MGEELGARRGPHLTERQATIAALDYSHEKAAYHQRKADENLAEVTRLQAKLDSLNEGEK
jgi:hypothetical protein